MTAADYRKAVNERLEILICRKDIHPTLCNAMHYSLTAGGKRLRPVLTLMANALFDGSMSECLDLACAVEMIHTYSLIHDDLPAMDNDELRRGKPTSHIVFGEAFAVLAGDGLLSAAFEVMTENALAYPERASHHLRAMQTVGAAAGTGGMLTGQAADIESEGQILTERELAYIHSHKTGAMITGALVAGAQLTDAGEEELEQLRLFGEHIGIAFQIIDDILDIEGTPKELGKTPGKDSRSRKFTFPTLFGIEASRRIAEENTEEAEAALAPLGKAAGPLCELARRMLKRGN